MVDLLALLERLVGAKVRHGDQGVLDGLLIGHIEDGVFQQRTHGVVLLQGVALFNALVIEEVLRCLVVDLAPAFCGRYHHQVGGVFGIQQTDVFQQAVTLVDH